MLRVELKWLTTCFFGLILSACSSVPTESEVLYSKSSREQIYNIAQWSFEGRLGLTGKNDSWQANINWEHEPNKEEIKLSGPLGQGATVIQLTGNLVSIDRGDGKVQSSTQPEAFINQQLGMFVPIRSLRYWIVGLPEPTVAFIETATGFVQSGWLVEFKQMQRVNEDFMPRKISVSNEQVKLKLMIDQWKLSVANAK
ncbi:MAG: outer rane lipoprotein LolB [Pseudomonadota bacterium]